MLRRPHLEGYVRGITQENEVLEHQLNELLTYLMFLPDDDFEYTEQFMQDEYSLAIKGALREYLLVYKDFCDAARRLED